jgi:hypothetical protein
MLVYSVKLEAQSLVTNFRVRMALPSILDPRLFLDMLILLKGIRPKL